MQFTKYSSIENSYREKYINSIIEHGYGNEEFVVTSKLDGANFSFICDGNEVQVASRTQIVDSTFFNCKPVIDKYSQDIRYLFKVFNDESPIEQIQVYGELIGDGINNRVKYCSGREFIVFDILVTWIEDNIVNLNYINYKVLKVLTYYTKLKLAPEHFRGNLQDSLTYCTNNLTFNSLIPNLLNNDYKKLEVNNEEGYVIKPVNYLTLRTGDRVIIKCKSPEFKESSNKGRPPAKIVTLTEEENIVLTKLTELITESRVYSVTSKLGELTSNDFGKVLGLYIKDVIEDYSKDNQLVISKNVNKQLNKLCSNTIRSVWLNVIN
jgi:Rnl2 family RNA ligase